MNYLTVSCSSPRAAWSRKKNMERCCLAAATQVTPGRNRRSCPQGASLPPTTFDSRWLGHYCPNLCSHARLQRHLGFPISALTADPRHACQLTGLHRYTQGAVRRPNRFTSIACSPTALKKGLLARWGLSSPYHRCTSSWHDTSAD